jgi:hypothetical protein
MKRMSIMVDRPSCNGAAYDDMRCRMERFSIGTKAMQNSWVEQGDEGVTIIAGTGDFSGTRGAERSRGAGIRV